MTKARKTLSYRPAEDVVQILKDYNSEGNGRSMGPVIDAAVRFIAQWPQKVQAQVFGANCADLMKEIVEDMIPHNEISEIKAAIKEALRDTEFGPQKKTTTSGRTKHSSGGTNRGENTAATA